MDDTRVRRTGHRLSVEVTVASDPDPLVGDLHQLEHVADAAIRRALPSTDVVRLNPSAHPHQPPA